MDVGLNLIEHTGPSMDEPVFEGGGSCPCRSDTIVSIGHLPHIGDHIFWFGGRGLSGRSFVDGLVEWEQWCGIEFVKLGWLGWRDRRECRS